MNRQSNNFDELNSFKSAVKREKGRSLLSFEGVSVTLVDAESDVEFSLPVNLIEEVWTLKTGNVHEHVSKVRTGAANGRKVYYVKGRATEILHKITEAKIKGGHSQCEHTESTSD